MSSLKEEFQGVSARPDGKTSDLVAAEAFLKSAEKLGLQPAYGVGTNPAIK